MVFILFVVFSLFLLSPGRSGKGNVAATVTRQNPSVSVAMRHDCQLTFSLSPYTQEFASESRRIFRYYDKTSLVKLRQS